MINVQTDARGHRQHPGARLRPTAPCGPDFKPQERYEAGGAVDPKRSALGEYRSDLRWYPENGWGLFGLAQSLKAQRKDHEAAEVSGRFEKAWAHADVTLAASRF